MLAKDLHCTVQHQARAKMSFSPVSSTYTKHRCYHSYMLKSANVTAMAWQLIFLCFLLLKDQLAKRNTLGTTNQQEMAFKNPQSIFRHLNKQFRLGMCWVSVRSRWLLTKSIFKDKHTVPFWKSGLFFYFLSNFIISFKTHNIKMLCVICANTLIIEPLSWQWCFKLVKWNPSFQINWYDVD